jgi:hypothetical protein
MSAFDSIPWLATHYPNANAALRGQEAAALADALSVTTAVEFALLAGSLEQWRQRTSWYSTLSDSIMNHYSLYVMQAQLVSPDPVPVPTSNILTTEVTAGGFLTTCVTRPSSWYVTNTISGDATTIAAGHTADAAALEARVEPGNVANARNMLVMIFGDPVRPNPPLDTSKPYMRDLIFNTMGFAEAFALFSLPLPY